MSDKTSDNIKYLPDILKIYQAYIYIVCFQLFCNLSALKIIRKKRSLCLIILRLVNLRNNKQLRKENLSSSLDNISTYSHYLTCDGEF